MVMLDVTFNADAGMSPELAARLCQCASGYESGVLLKCGNRDLRLDSLIGILSMKMPRGSRVTVVADGSDEQEAARGIMEILVGN